MSALSPEEVNSLLEQRRQIDIQLSLSRMPSTAPPASKSRRGSISTYPYLRNDGSRSYSKSFSGSMSRTVSSGRGHGEVTQISQSLSQHSAPTMARSGSRGTSSSSSMAFTNTGRITPLINTIVGPDTSVIESWTTRQDDPVTGYTFGPERKGELEQVAEIGSGEHPDDYFARMGSMPLLSVMPSPFEVSNIGPWPQSHHRGSTSSQRRQNFGITTPSTPSTATLTIATTYASDMSRDNSFCNESILGASEMMNVHSNNSVFTDNSIDESYHIGASFPSSTAYAKPLSSSEEQSLLLAGAGGGSRERQFPFSFPDFESLATSPIQLEDLAPFMENMQRSNSNESNSSTSSTKSRAAARLQRQNQAASTRLIAPAPKVGGDEAIMSVDPSQRKTVSIKSKDGSVDRVVGNTHKQPYQRPKHERVYCNLCSEHPEGFRGTHELGRHHDRQHNERVKKWICAEPANGVINDGFRPINSLLKCKSCSGQKKYGAYYNAAAHLRRAHFRPKQRGRGKTTKTDAKPEKRGGNGGGDWPPMDELKRWMEEVHEIVGEGQQADGDEEEDDEESIGFDRADDVKNQSLSTASVSPAVFSDAPASADTDTQMTDAYPAPVSNFDTQSMQNMQFGDLSQCIGLTMPVDLSQPSFVDSHFTPMNEDMAFIDSFAHTFDYPDLFNTTFQY